jgi:hypothetical protein
VSPADKKSASAESQKKERIASFSSALTFEHVDTSSKTSTSSNHSGGFSSQVFPFFLSFFYFTAKLCSKLSRRWPVPLHQRRRADRFTYGNAFQQLSAVPLGGFPLDSGGLFPTGGIPFIGLLITDRLMKLLGSCRSQNESDFIVNETADRAAAQFGRLLSTSE